MNIISEKSEKNERNNYVARIGELVYARLSTVERGKKLLNVTLQRVDICETF